MKAGHLRRFGGVIRGSGQAQTFNIASPAVQKLAYTS